MIDIAERDMMHEIALVEVEAMMQERKSKMQMGKETEDAIEETNVQLQLSGHE